MDEAIARKVTSERVKRVAQGQAHPSGATIDPFDGGFQFCRLSEQPLFDPDSQIRRDVRFDQLTATGTGYGGDSDLPLLGVHEGRAIYLLFNGILKDKSVAGGNVLSGPVFDQLPSHAGPKVIYAVANRMGARAALEGVVFKQTPYALSV